MTDCYTAIGRRGWDQYKSPNGHRYEYGKYKTGDQWDNYANPPDIRRWFKNLKQPDNPGVSCCGEADAYWADSFEVEGDHYVAIITDERPDEPIGRPHIDVGTRIVVPNNKMKWDQGNPTGHGVIFVNTSGHVYCYVPPGGV